MGNNDISLNTTCCNLKSTHFQVLIVAFAFSTAGILINTAFAQWEHNPTITTLDTIAAPIDDIQFPTVTVCNDYTSNPPDNWAILENLLNLVNFDCRKNDHTCNTTDMIRKDFYFVTKLILDAFKEWLLKAENIG